MVAADFLSTESADLKVCVRCNKSEHIIVAEVRKSDAMDGERWHIYAEISAQSRSFLFFSLLLALAKTSIRFLAFIQSHCGLGSWILIGK